jgi:Protein of unknown function (DUF998)
MTDANHNREEGAIDEVFPATWTRDANRRRLCAVSAAVLWITAAVGYVTLEAIAAARFRPSYSYVHNYISDLGVTSQGMFQGRVIDSPLAYLMNTAFYLQGTFLLVGAVLVARAVGSRKSGLFLSLAATNATGNILVGTVHGGPIAGVDSTPRNNPAARAVVLTSSNNRRGRSEIRSRLRIPTNTVG